MRKIKEFKRFIEMVYDCWCVGKDEEVFNKFSISHGHLNINGKENFIDFYTFLKGLESIPTNFKIPKELKEKWENIMEERKNAISP